MFTRLKGYLDFTVAQLQKQDPRLADALVAELEKRGERKLEDDEVIGAHPMVRQHIDEARLEEVLAQLELRRPGLAALRAVGSPDGIDQELLVELVAAGTMNADEAAAVGLAVELYLVCGEHLPLVTLVRNVVGEGGVDVVARYTAAHWTALLKAMSDAVPSGASAEAVGATLAARFAIMRPGAGLLGRLPSTQLAAVEQALDAAAV